jgi:hypothetical protein
MEKEALQRLWGDLPSDIEGKAAIKQQQKQ